MNETVLFTRVSFEKYVDIISSVEKTINDLSRQIQQAIEDGGDSWHDNFSYEEITRQIRMQDTRLSELKLPLQNCKIIESTKIISHVTISAMVTIEIDNQHKSFRIEGYGYVDLKSNIISYNTPIGKVLLGKKMNDSFSFNKKTITIKKIEL